MSQDLILTWASQGHLSCNHLHLASDFTGSVCQIVYSYFHLLNNLVPLRSRLHLPYYLFEDANIADCGTCMHGPVKRDSTQAASILCIRFNFLRLNCQHEAIHPLHRALGHRMHSQYIPVYCECFDSDDERCKWRCAGVLSRS